MSSTESSQSTPQHRVAIAIGSNIGDRQGNVGAAIHRLRSYVTIDRLSSTYETKPVGFTEQPDFLNLACTGWTSLGAPQAAGCDGEDRAADRAEDQRAFGASRHRLGSFAL